MKKKQFDKLYALLQSQVNQANQVSPWETALANEYNTIDSFLKSGDYRNLPKGVSIDLMSQADNNRMRQMMMGRDSSGQAAKGVMGQIGQSQRQLLNDQASRDWSGAYEEKVGDLQNRKLGLGQALQGYHSDRTGRSMQGAFGLFEAGLKRPKGSFMGDLFKGLLQGGASAALSFI